MQLNFAIVRINRVEDGKKNFTFEDSRTKRNFEVRVGILTYKVT